MWELDDVKRSVRRYVSQTLVALPADPVRRWTIRFSREQVRDEERPAGMIEAGDMIRSGDSRVSLDQGNVTETVPLTLTLWPEIQEPREAERRATRLAQQLYDLIRFGLMLDHGVSGRSVSGPERIPLYDYSDVAASGTAEERRGPEDPHDVMWAESYSSRAIQDPDDPRRYAIVLELTVSWERPGRIPTDVPAPVVQRMPSTFRAEVNPDA